MFSALRRVFRPNAHSRRVMSGLCAAFVLATVVFSSVFVAAEADHECRDHDCPICLELQNCVENFRLTGSATPSCDTQLPVTVRTTVETVSRVRRAPATTLLSLDVRFDE